MENFWKKNEFRKKSNFFIDFFDQIPVKWSQKSNLTKNSDSPSNFTLYCDWICFLSIIFKENIKKVWKVIFWKSRFLHIFRQKSTTKFSKSLERTFITSFYLKKNFFQWNEPLSEYFWANFHVSIAISVEALMKVKKQKRPI